MSILSSVAPILIFSFPFDSDSVNPVFNALNGLPLFNPSTAKGSTLTVDNKTSAIPIPIYLDEQLTGLYVQSENKNVDIATEQNDAANSTKPFLTQKSISNTVSINLTGKKDSIFLAALLALVDLAYPLLVKAKYRVSYLNGSTVIIGGLLSGISAQVEDDTDLVNVSLVIHKADSLGPPKFILPSIPSLVGQTLSTGVPPVPTGVLQA